MLYYGIGKYISLNSRKGFWGKGAIDAISQRLDKELPGLKGFSARNLRNMRAFYEEWIALDHERDEQLILADASAKYEIPQRIISCLLWPVSVPRQTCLPPLFRLDQLLLRHMIPLGHEVANDGPQVPAVTYRVHDLLL